MLPPKVTEENFLDLFADYANWKYSDTVYDYYDVCPYDLDFDSDELVYKQIVTWLMCEKKNLFGKTALDEFVDEFVDDTRLASKILQMKSLVYDTFLVEKAVDANNRMLIRSTSDGRVFTVEMMGSNPSIYSKGRLIIGRIHPWHDNGTYRTTGIFHVIIKEGRDQHEGYRSLNSEMFNNLHQMLERDLQKKAESLTIPSNPTMGPLLKKFPIDWVNGICDSLGIDTQHVKKKKIRIIKSILTSEDSLRRVVSGLSEDERIGLRLVFAKDCAAKYSDLCRRVGKDDTGLRWDKMPASVVGRLRRHGLLMVGKKRIMTRTYKMAVIPTDVARHLGSCL